MFTFRFLCLFTFRQHKQLPMVARFFKGYASLEVMRQREGRNGPYFLSVATGRSQRPGGRNDQKVATDYSFICLLRFMSVCCQSVTDGNCNFSAVRSPIGLKLGGDLGLVSQISMHVLVSRFVCFLYCKQTKEQKNFENRGFTKPAFSPPCRVRLI
jgi:hypothetical protein